MLKPAYSSLQTSLPSVLISYIAQEVNFGPQRSFPALAPIYPFSLTLMCSRRSWPSWKESSSQRGSSGIAPWLPKRCKSTDFGSRTQVKST